MILGEEYTNAFEEELKEKLSKLERKVLYLHLQGMEYLNIAEFMDKSPKTIDNACSGSKRKHASFWKKCAGLKKSKNVVLKIVDKQSSDMLY